MIADFRGRSVLVTGGTMGIGLETALAFAERGAHCAITYKLGTADEAAVRRRFADAGAPDPLIVRGDAGHADDTTALLTTLRQHWDQVDVFVSNASTALMIGDLRDYSLTSLSKTIEYSAWPMVAYTDGIRELFGRYPRYVVGMSSTGPDRYAMGYDFMAASQAVMETLCRYMSYRLSKEDVRININVVRSTNVQTMALDDTSADFAAFERKFRRPEQHVPARDVATCIVALCSGLLDGVRGQTIIVDRGVSFFDNLMHLFNDRERLGL